MRWQPRSIIFSLSMVSCACMLSFNALANSSMDELFDIPLEELLKIKITASTLTDKNLRTVPSSITIFTHQQIQALGVDYLHELINYVPGFQSFRQEESGDEYYQSSRGHRSSTASREVLILIDGQRFNREFDNAAGAPMLSLSNIEKIEFIRGPGSALYGSNAFLGVINITTRTSQNETSLSYGSHANSQAHILATKEFDNLTVDAYINAYNDKGDSFNIQESSTHTPQSTHDPRAGYDVNAKLGWSKSRINLMHFERTSSEFYTLGRISNTANETNNNYSSAQFQNELDWSDHLSTQYSLRHYEEDYDATSVDPVLGLINFDQEAQGNEFKLHNDWDISINQSLQFGLEYQQNQINNVVFKTANFGSDMLYGEEAREITGLYLQHQLRLFDATELTLGIRHDNYSHIGSALSPRFGLTHQLSDIQTIKLLYGEAFRAPTTNELKLENVFGAAGLAGNADLVPETVKTWELVWMGNWQQRSLAMSFFNNVIENAIVRDDTISPSTFVNSSSKESSQGVEIEYITELSSDWQLRGTYTWFNNLSRDDFRQADHLASAIINYQQQQWNFNVSANYAAARSMLAGSTETRMDNYWLLNSKLQYRVNNKQAVYLQAKNLLDKDYKTPYQRATFTEGVPNRGRELEVGMRWEFE